MALRSPTRTTDHITLISWLDTAVDQGVEDFAEIVKEYTLADVPDPSILPRREGADPPTQFTLRPLSEREIGVVEDLARSVTVGAGGDLSVDTSTHELHWQIVRFALVDVQNLPGWVGKRERFYSWDVLTMAELEEMIDRHTIDLLGSVARRWSVLEKKELNRSGSLQGETSGTNQTPGAPVLLTATSANTMKDTEGCTAAQKTGTDPDA